MAITNGYATVAEFLALIKEPLANGVDDPFIEDLIERASRAIDGHCGTWFYADTQTRLYDVPRRGRVLKLDAPLLTITASMLLNGTGTAIASTEYKLWPYNSTQKWEIRLEQSSSTIWEPGTDGDTEGVISVTGTWGLSRAATDAESMGAILATNDACLSIALNAYKRRFGVGSEGVATVTGAGVVITPRGMPAEARQLLAPYVRHL